MTSSRRESRPGATSPSTANSDRNFTVKQQPDLFSAAKEVVPGSLNDGSTVRGILIQAIKDCGKSRAQIADEMSFLAGREITERMLNGFTAESREDYRWPAELDRAFCYVTGDNRLLRCRAELAGYRVITESEADLLELGRQYLIRQRASEQVELLEKRLAGIEIGGTR